MRKWFFICSGFVFVMIAFSVYVIYDTKQFIDNLPQLPPQGNDSSQQPTLRNEVGLEPHTACRSGGGQPSISFGRIGFFRGLYGR